MNCPKCNYPIKEGQVLCNVCGYNIQQHSQKQRNSKLMNKIMVIWIVILFITAGTIIYFFVPYTIYNGYTYRCGSPKAILDVKQINNDFVIKIVSISRKVDINETSWEIMNQNGTTIARGETYNIYDYGKIGIQNFIGDISKTGLYHYNYVENSKGGYMKDDNGNNLTNSSDYWDIHSTHSQIVFMNNDEIAEPGAWKISAEDQYFIRGIQNGGSTPSKYIFKLIFDPSNEQIGMIELT